MPRARLIRVLLTAGICLLPALGLANGHAEDHLVGGPCTYATFSGKATILSVGPAPTKGAKTPYPPQTVTYTFTPDIPVAGEPLYHPDQIQTLTLLNGMPPGPQFLQKYALAPGKVFPCTLRIIRKGCCTPVLFRFTTIDLADYFELRPR